MLEYYWRNNIIYIIVICGNISNPKVAIAVLPIIQYMAVALVTIRTKIEAAT